MVAILVVLLAVVGAAAALAVQLGSDEMRDDKRGTWYALMSARPGANGAPVGRQLAWVGYAACAWTVLFAAPHVWWALGNPFAFPGGEVSYRTFMSATWRIVFDWVVVLLCSVGFAVSLALARPWGRHVPRWALHSAAWIACALLSIRGVGGVAIDGLTNLDDPSRPIWTVGFVIGGLLFGGLAWQAHRAR